MEGLTNPRPTTQQLPPRINPPPTTPAVAKSVGASKTGDKSWEI